MSRPLLALERVEFDSPFRVTDAGEIVGASGVYAPEGHSGVTR